MLNCWVIVQPKKGNLLLRPFAAREMNMSSDKKGCCRLDPFLLNYWIIIDLPNYMRVC